MSLATVRYRVAPPVVPNVRITPWLHAVAVAFLCGSGIRPVLGQDPGAEDHPVVYETAIVRARPLVQATASVSVLERERIAALDVVSVAELIRFVPGLDITASGPRSGQATAQIRGGDPNFTVVMLDGVPLNDATDQIAGGAVNLNGIPVEHVERIEIIRGPQSSSLGSAALSGVINIVTRRGSTEEPRAAVDVAGGSDSMAMGALSLSRAAERHDYFVGATWERQDETVADDSFEQLNVQGNARVETGAGEFRVTGRVTSWEGRDYPEASGGPVYGSGQTRFSDTEEASLGVEGWFGSGRRHRVDLQMHRRDLERETPAVGAVVPASRETTRYARWRLGWSVPVLESEKIRLAAGADVQLEDGTNDSTLSTAFGDVDGSYGQDRTIGGAYVEVVSSRGPLLLELGARVDEPEGSEAELSPRLGLTYAFPRETTRLRVSLGRGFKLPSFFVQGSPPALGGNPDLEPETSVGGDVEIEHTWASLGFTLSVAAFHYRFDDLITFLFDPYGFVNLDEVESTGGELDLEWRPLDVLSLATQVTYQDVVDRETSETLRQRPHWIGALHASWRVGERVLWSVDGQWVSESFDQSFVVFDRESTAGYQLYGTSLTADLGRDWELHGRIDNLSDKSYETFIGFPGRGRHFRVGLRHRFG